MRPPNAKAELTRLTLRGRQPQLRKWGKCTNFDTLQVLKITGITDVAVLEWAADFARFPSLVCLGVQNPNDDDSCIIRFFNSLPPLESLTVLGVVDEPMVHAVSKKHATSLRSLSLPKLFCSADLVFTLREQYSYLEHLETTVSRTEGDSNEIAIYTALGSHPHLRSLRLDLDCSVDIGNEPRCAEPAFDVVHRDVNYRQSHVQRTLLNCALDSALATSIFNAIARAKPALSAPLLRVELNVINAGVIVSGGRHCSR